MIDYENATYSILEGAKMMRGALHSEVLRLSVAPIHDNLSSPYEPQEAVPGLHQSIFEGDCPRILSCLSAPAIDTSLGAPRLD